MQRIAIIGSGGAGKSTLAKRLGELSGLPVVHLDSLYWKPGWVESDAAEWAATQRRIVEGDAWIIDGNYGATMEIRLARADTVVLLDPPRRVCLWRIAKRRIQYRGRGRPDMAEGCPERLNWAFVKWVWDYPATRRPAILARLDALPAETLRFRITGRRDMDAFLHAFQACPHPPTPSPDFAGEGE